MADLLIVEPDTAAADAMRALLRQSGHSIRIVGTADEAQVAIADQVPQAIIMERTLPDMDGLVFISDLARHARTPGLIVLSDLADHAESTIALRLGADDFMLKPIETENLIARLDAVLRRAKPRAAVADQGMIEVDNMTIARGTVRIDGHRVALTQTEYRILTVLAQRPDEVLSRTVLIREVWGQSSDRGYSHSLDVHIDRLRHKLDQSGDGPRVRNVRRQGFMLTTAASTVDPTMDLIQSATE